MTKISNEACKFERSRQREEVRPEPESEEDYWERAARVFLEEVPELKCKLEREFRRLLGTESDDETCASSAGE